MIKDKFEEYSKRFEGELREDKFKFDFFDRLVVMWTLLTRIPLPKRFWPKVMPNGARTLTLAPIVGGILGFITGVVITFVNIMGIGQIGSVWIGAAFYAMAGWALHLDGWGDLWDGIGSGRRGEELRSVMKDSRLGSFGAISLILAFGLWTGLLLALGQHQEALALMTAGAVWRFGSCTAAFRGRYPWESGMGKGYVDGFGGYEMFLSAISVLLFLPFAPMEWILSVVLVFVTSYGAASHMNGRLGGVNGDVLGACAVAGELITLMVFAL